MKTIDSGAGAVVFEQAGYIHELDPKSGKTRVVNIIAAGDFPWMMPNWEDVTNRMTNMALSPTGKRVVVEARGEIFTIPAEKGDVRNLTQLERLGRTRSGVVARRQVRFLFQRQVRRVQTRDRSAGRTDAAARDHARQSRRTTTRHRGRPIRRSFCSPTPT